MIAWKSDTPTWKQLIYNWRLLRTQLYYFDHLSISRKRYILPSLSRQTGYQSKLSGMYNCHAGERCFIICNGPSLSQLDLGPLKNEVTIGCNGIYKRFSSWGFHTNYLAFEDVEQFEIRARELESLKGPLKLAAIYNSYAIRDRKDWLFFNAPRRTRARYYWEDAYPMFSTDFASIVHLGSTVTYIMLQLAFFMGCNPVYLIGLDHNYGKLPELFPPGKIVVTKENFDMVKECHFDPNYYKIGDVIGVPHVAKQEAAYSLTREVYERHGRKVVNLSPGSKLSVFDRDDYADVVSRQIPA